MINFSLVGKVMGENWDFSYNSSESSATLWPGMVEVAAGRNVL